ncbi:PTS galactitol transporter subunit IIC [Thermovorax subterraneus]|nr:PTS galactitol transporter subunit IIC [Thermovorax subterraneus]
MFSFKDVIQYILDLGPGIFLHFVMLIIGLIIRMRFTKALSAAITLGVAFLGMSAILDFMFAAISPAANAFVENTGIKLNALDLGWTPNAAIAWAWPYAFLMFPLQIAINLLMLALGWTNCLNVDMWNVWNKVFTGVLVAGVTGSLPIAFIVCAIMVVFELKNADLTQKQVYEITNIPGIALPHSMALTGVIIAPLNRLLDFIPGINKIKLDADGLKEKLGIFAENHILGFIVGLIIALFARYNFKDTLTLAMKAATALVLFPMVAGLFMKALAPISEAAAEFMKSRFPGREFYIGLDWPFLAGQPALWVTTIILVPIILLMAVLLPGNTTLPFGGILNICFAATALIITRGDLFRMIILGIMTTPLYLWVASYFAPVITDLARKVGTINIPPNQLITWNGMEAPEFRYFMSQIGLIFKGQLFPGIIILPIYALLIWYYWNYMTRREKEVKERLGL